MKNKYLIYLSLLFSPAALGEDFADSLDDYARFLEYAPDTILKMIADASPMASLSMNIGFWMIAIGIPVMMAIGGLKYFKDKGEYFFDRSIGLALAGVFLISSTQQIFYSESYDRLLEDAPTNFSPTFDPSTGRTIVLETQPDSNALENGSSKKYIEIDDQPLGATMVAAFYIRSMQFINTAIRDQVNAMYSGLSSANVYRFMGEESAAPNSNDKIDRLFIENISPILGEFTTQCTDYVKSIPSKKTQIVKEDRLISQENGKSNAEPFVRKSILDVNSRDFQLLGLLGGVRLGTGFSLSENLKPNNKNYQELFLPRKSSSFTGAFLTSGLNEASFDRRAIATDVLYETKNKNTNLGVSLPVYSYDFWFKAFSAEKNTPVDYNIINGSDYITPSNHPLSHLIIKENKYQDPSDNPARRASLEVAFPPNSTYDLNNCWSAYVAAETALTTYLDAKHDTSLEKNWFGLGDNIYGTVGLLRKEARILGNNEDVINIHSTNIAALSTLREQNNIFKLMGANNSGGALSLGLEITGEIKELFMPAAIQGVMTSVVGLFVFMYIISGIVFGLTPFLGTRILLLWFTSISAATMILVINLFLLNSGAAMLYSQMLNFTQGGGGLAEVDIFESLSFVVTYYSLLTSIAVIDILIVLTVLQLGSSFKGLTGSNAGMVGALGSAAGFVAFSAMSKMSGAFGALTGGGGGGGGENPLNENLTNSTKEPSQRNNNSGGGDNGGSAYSEYVDNASVNPESPYSDDIYNIPTENPAPEKAEAQGLPTEIPQRQGLPTEIPQRQGLPKDIPQRD